MKNEYENGGMKVTDVECLDRSIKLRQFIRAYNAKHCIAKIQSLVTGYSTLNQEYSNVTNKEDICSSAQHTMNLITDHNRELYKSFTYEEVITDKNLIDEISSINIRNFLKRKGKLFMTCIMKQLNTYGIETLAELVQSNEHVSDRNLVKSIQLILGSIPKSLVKIAENYNEDINSDYADLKYMLISANSRMAIDTITVKQLQVKLKLVLKRVDVTDFKNKLGVNEFDQVEILQFRKNCKNSKLRNIYFRLINRDFFTHSRMFKYKMTNSDKCPRCGQIETIRHLLWDCTQVKQIWNIYNTFMIKLGNEQDCVKKYDNVYSIGHTPATVLIKIKVIQELIQIVRPQNWNNKNMENLVAELVCNEKYIALHRYELSKFLTKWKVCL